MPVRSTPMRWLDTPMPSPGFRQLQQLRINYAEVSLPTTFASSLTQFLPYPQFQVQQVKYEPRHFRISHKLTHVHVSGNKRERRSKRCAKTFRQAPSLPELSWQ